MQHDVPLLTEYVIAAHVPGVQCCVSGWMLLELIRYGDRLSIDRIDSTKGYVAGNIQVISLYLNSAKGCQRHVPKWAIKALNERMHGAHPTLQAA